MRSAFAGHIEEIPFIHVDNFENDLVKNAYFLSHYHSDHVVGLKGDLLPVRLKRNNAYIYASEVTIAIIKKECPSLAPCLKALELGSNTVFIKKDDQEVFLSVKTLPAGHSLGSVMFLFEYNKKKILYTGDFRISRNSVSKYTHFHDKNGPIQLDAMYVDTTFQNVPSFPKRSEVVRNVILHIKRWLSVSKRNRVIMLTSAAYGYEYVCNAIYDEVKMKTCVGDHYWQIYSQFPREIYGMTDDPRAKIHLQTKYRKKEQSNPFQLEIYFSALRWGDKQNVEEEFLNIDDNKIYVCFSTHCGRDELIYFINYFKPKKIVGFPEEYGIESKLDLEFPDDTDEKFTISPKKRKVEMSSVIVGKKASKSVLKQALDW